MWRIWGSSPHCVSTNIQSSREAKRVGCVRTLSWGSVMGAFPGPVGCIAICSSFIGHVFSIGGAVSPLRRKHT